MKIIKSPRRMQQWADGRRRRGKSIGFIPTMGALHEGHRSLMRAARKRCHATVVSLFVNPAQFGPNEDYARYPRDPGGDAALCRREKVDILFMPSAGAIYPEGHDTIIEVGRIGGMLEGALRPGHFSGVATVVAKLFMIVKPDFAFFGRKDYQQTVVIRQMTRDINIPVKIVVCPTIREKDGLAMSSRNRYLSGEERRAACVLYRALHHGRDLIRNGERSAAAVRNEMTRRIRKESLARLDYAVIADPETLRAPRRIEGPVVLLLAVRIGKTRLIDNLFVKS